MQFIRASFLIIAFMSASIGVSSCGKSSQPGVASPAQKSPGPNPTIPNGASGGGVEIGDGRTSGQENEQGEKAGQKPGKPPHEQPGQKPAPTSVAEIVSYQVSSKKLKAGDELQLSVIVKIPFAEQVTACMGNFSPKEVKEFGIEFSSCSFKPISGDTLEVSLAYRFNGQSISQSYILKRLSFHFKDRSEAAGYFQDDASFEVIGATDAKPFIFLNAKVDPVTQLPRTDSFSRLALEFKSPYPVSRVMLNLSLLDGESNRTISLQMGRDGELIQERNGESVTVRVPFNLSWLRANESRVEVNSIIAMNQAMQVVEAVSGSRIVLKLR